MRVAFLHPDLGLGGAERLIVDAAAGLSLRGHDVKIFTSHYERERSFAETRAGMFGVVVRGDWLPRAVFGRLHILFAILRMVWLALCVAAGGERFDVLVVDQVSAAVPLLRLLTRSRILFYLHYPDLLLAPRGSVLRALYRLPFDTLEQASTGLSHGVLVNSHFTAGAFRDTFRVLAAGGVEPAVLYPCVETGTAARAATPGRGRAKTADAARARPPPQVKPRRILLSINRFERKKDIGVLIRAFAEAKPSADWHLVIAGGYDPRLNENVEHFDELVGLAKREGLVADALGLVGDASDFAAVLPAWPRDDASSAVPPFPRVLTSRNVTFIRSFSDAQKGALLSAASAVAYTPRGEHFGIVPLECMAAARPVLASASGGPLESIIDGVTGILCDGSDGWRDAVRALTSQSDAARSRMGSAGAAHVAAKFSRTAFAASLEAHCEALVRDAGRGGRGQAAWLPPVLWLILICIAFSAVVVLGAPLFLLVKAISTRGQPLLIEGMKTE